jgi:hypothetical protein
MEFILDAWLDSRQYVAIPRAGYMHPLRPWHQRVLLHENGGHIGQAGNPPRVSISDCISVPGPRFPGPGIPPIDTLEKMSDIR